jgi:hypothetical protein
MYFIKVNLSTQEREVCKKIEKTEWLKMLSNDKMDWVTNLILYDLYGKNAISYCGEIKTRNEWLIIKKKKDVEYWKKILTAN